MLLRNILLRCILIHSFAMIISIVSIIVKNNCKYIINYYHAKLLFAMFFVICGVKL